MNGYQARAAAMELRVRGGRLLSSWDAGSAVLQKDAEALLAAAKHLDAYAAAYFDAKRAVDAALPAQPPQPATVQPRCEHCKWWERERQCLGECVRYPQAVVKAAYDFCGEFTPRENA